MTNSFQPILTAPKDNKRLLYLARFSEAGDLVELDFDGIWHSESESHEIPQVHHFWASASGIEEPTHWAYQDEPLPQIGIRAAALEYVFARNAYELATKLASGFAPPKSLGHGDPVLLRYRHAREALTAAVSSGEVAATEAQGRAAADVPNRYQVKSAASKINGYYSPPKEVGKVPMAFQAAKAECLAHLRAALAHVEGLTCEQFIEGWKEGGSKWWSAAEPSVDLQDANNEIACMREDWQKLGEALGFTDFVDPEVIIAKANELRALAH